MDELFAIEKSIGEV